MRSKTTVLVALLSTAGALLAAGSPSDALVLGPVVGPDWAFVTAIVNPQDATVGCEFEYGTTSAYGSTIPCDPQPSGASPEGVSARITGLTPSTTYHYRVALMDSGGTSYGSDGIFTTLPPPPLVMTTPATEMTARSVKLNGTVDPNGSLVTDCHFEYGLADAYGQQAPCDQAPGSGTAAVPVTATVPFTPSTPLHYRLVATTASGTSAGADVIALAIVDPPPPPTIAGTAIQTIARPTATGAATVNPNGSPTECWFEDTADGARIPCTPQPGDGTSPVAVTGGIPVHGASISFRVVASNAGGTTYGPEISAPVVIADGPEMFGILPRPGTLRIAAIGKPRQRRIAVSIVCDGASRDFCRGTLTLAARGRLHGRRRVVVLGRAPYDLTVGQQRATIAVRLSPRGRRLLRLHRHLRIAAHTVPARAA